MRPSDTLWILPRKVKEKVLTLVFLLKLARQVALYKGCLACIMKRRLREQFKAA